MQQRRLAADHGRERAVPHEIAPALDAALYGRDHRRTLQPERARQGEEPTREALREVRVARVLKADEDADGHDDRQQPGPAPVALPEHLRELVADLAAARLVDEGLGLLVAGQQLAPDDRLALHGLQQRRGLLGFEAAARHVGRHGAHALAPRVEVAAHGVRGDGIHARLQVVDQELDALDPDGVEHLDDLGRGMVLHARALHPVPRVRDEVAELVGLAALLVGRPQRLVERGVAARELLAERLLVGERVGGRAARAS